MNCDKLSAYSQAFCALFLEFHQICCSFCMPVPMLQPINIFLIVKRSAVFFEGLLNMVVTLQSDSAGNKIVNRLVLSEVQVFGGLVFVSSFRQKKNMIRCRFHLRFLLGNVLIEIKKKNYFMGLERRNEISVTWKLESLTNSIFIFI